MLVYQLYLDCIRKKYVRKKATRNNKQQEQRHHHYYQRALMQITKVIKASGCAEMALECEAVDLRRSYTLQSFFRKAGKYIAIIQFIWMSR